LRMLGPSGITHDLAPGAVREIFEP
jgi:hypothetical protein